MSPKDKEGSKLNGGLFQSNSINVNQMAMQCNYNVFTMSLEESQEFHVEKVRRSAFGG
jgi:hypothetical protein